MTKLISPEEQDQINAIVTRWVTYDTRGCIIYASAVGVIFVTINVLKLGMLFALTVSLLLSVPSPFLLSRWMGLRFSRGLSKEDRELIPHAKTVPVRAQDSFDYLQRACKINPQMEYLRSSQQTQGETLLRAATYTNDTPQEQLLRPSQTQEE